MLTVFEHTVLFSDCRKPRDEYVYEVWLLDPGVKGTWKQCC